MENEIQKQNHVPILSKFMECTTLRVNPKVNRGLREMTRGRRSAPLTTGVPFQGAMLTKWGKLCPCGAGRLGKLCPLPNFVGSIKLP